MFKRSFIDLTNDGTDVKDNENNGVKVYEKRVTILIFLKFFFLLHVFYINIITATVIPLFI